MSEYLAAHITIGGPVPRRLVPRLCQILQREGLTLGWGEAPFVPGSAGDLLQAAVEIGGTRLLRLYDEQARWGQFEELESWLIQHQIPFDRFNEGKYEISAGQFSYRPGKGGVTSEANTQEQIVIEARPLWPLLDRVAAARRAVRQQDSSAALSELTVIRGVLRRSLPPRVPPLTALEFVTRPKQRHAARKRR